MLAFASLTILATAGLLLAEWKGSRVGIWVAKPLAAIGFVAVGLAVGGLDSPAGRWVIGGLVLCLIGDVLLIPRDREHVFQAGIGSFLLGHVAYVGAFITAGIDWGVAAWALAATVIPVVIVLRWLLPNVPPDFKIPVYAYTCVISAMVVAAVGAFASGAPLAALIGALLFYASDIAVARDRFVTSSFTNGAWGLPAYFGGQLFIASAAAAMG